MSQQLDSGDSAAVAMSSDVMIGAVIILFVVVVFVFILYLYARRYMGAAPRLGTSTRLVFVPPGPGHASPHRRGLDPAVLQELPVTVYRAAEFADTLECAVCLSELADGEEVRLLPKCSHGFHVECIDMWFYSHSTCPLCRCPVQLGSDEESQSPVLPANVLFCGVAAVPRGSAGAADGDAQEEEEEEEWRITTTPTTTTRPRSGALVIEIPAGYSSAGRRGAGWGNEEEEEEEEHLEGGSHDPQTQTPLSPLLPSSRMAGGEESSHMMMMMGKTPPSARSLQRSLRRLLSRGKMAVAGVGINGGPSQSSSPRLCSSLSPSRGDIEQGRHITPTPATPKTPSPLPVHYF